MSEFEDVVHHVATIGEHVIEYVEGRTEIRFNGQTINANEIEHVINAIVEASGALGLVVNATV
jgi:phenylacetate-coenzyme A ligase PaaK-like adenylate-forming protein